MHKKRLLKLADLLEKDASDKNGVKFDLGEWGSMKDSNAPISCGTTACAMGLAALSGKFKKQGLSYRTYDEVDDNGKISVSIDVIYTYANGVEEAGTYAAASLFDISHEAASFLFTPSTVPNKYTTGAKGERYLAKRIRAYVAGEYPELELL
jgi:hypothetical protein